MTIIDRIFQEVAGISIPHFFITVEFSAMGCEMPERIEAFLWEKYEIILRGANGRKFVYHKGEWRLIFTFFPTDRVVDERYALKNKGSYRLFPGIRRSFSPVSYECPVFHI